MQSKAMVPFPVWEGISPRANFEAKKFRLKILQEQTPQGRLAVPSPQPYILQFSFKLIYFDLLQLQRNLQVVFLSPIIVLR